MKSQLMRIALVAAICFASMPGSARAEDCSGSPGAGTPCVDEGNPCTTDVCDAGTTCLHNNNTAPCNDGEFCNGDDQCAAGACVSGVADLCTETTGAGKAGGFFRYTIPDDWDGDLVIINHGFDLNDKKIRPHHTCSSNVNVTCDQDSDCGSGNFCNNISYLGLDQLLLPMDKAVAASTYSKSGWAVFRSSKDIKDIIKAVKKDPVRGAELKRVIVTGFSLGGAVTGDATLKLKIDGALPLCAAVGGGLPTWDVAQDVRLVYDWLCDDVSAFTSAPDLGEVNSASSGNDAIGVAIKVDKCFGNIGLIQCQLGTCSVSAAACGNGYADCPMGETCVPEPGSCGSQQIQRRDDFIALTNFTGFQGDDAGINLASAIGFATLGLGDFVRDPDRLGSKRIGLNDTLDYSVIGTDSGLADDFNAPRLCSLNSMITCTDDGDCPEGAGTCEGGVQRLTKGPGRSKLTKASYPDFTVGKGAKVEYPILLMAGANDWLVIPEFERVYTTALTTGAKDYTQTWIDTFGHCVFTEEEITALFNEYFTWLGPYGGSGGTQPSAQDVEDACLALPTGVDGDTCNFNSSFSPGYLSDRIPVRADWPAAAAVPSP